MQNSNKFALGVIVLVVLGLGGGWYALNHVGTPEAAKVAAPVAAAVTPTPDGSAVTTPGATARYPVPAGSINSNQKNLPVLDESDPTFLERLNELFGENQVKSIFNTVNFIRRVVVSADNAKEFELPLDYSPIHPVPGNFLALSRDGKLWFDPKNEARYTPYINLVANADMRKVAALYFDFYPLFQSAFREINPKGYFNDRAIEVMDHLLATPEESEDPIELTAMNKSYHYADQGLESLSGSQKILVRMGAKNAAIVKSKLRKLRELLILGK